MTDRRAEGNPATVPEMAKQAGESQSLPDWVEPSVWTSRMLAALNAGGKGGKWFSLIDKVSSLKNLRSAFRKVEGNKGAAGVDHVSIEQFAMHLETNLGSLSESLRKGTYRPQRIRRVCIPKPGSQEKRPLGIPTVIANCTF